MNKSHDSLGIQRVANMLKLAELKNGIKKTRSKDNAVRRAFYEQEKITQKYATPIGL